MKKSFQEALLSYLQSSTLAYQDTRITGPFKPRNSEIFLQPLVNDIVIYKDSKEKIRFGKITEVLSNNTVKLLCLQFNKPILQDFHIKTLKLLHRPTEWNPQTGIPL